MKNIASDIDNYISGFPIETQKLLKQMRSLIKKTVPTAEEVISYGMPAFRLHGILVYYAGYKHHIGFYPTASGIREFKAEFSEYKSSKGAVQFPIDKPLPLDLITRIIKFRVQENIRKKEINN
ncbi:MAG: DUF1801 domain-containing protein [Bacteroidota bacterium]|jgi:uncharacterized protein YdhG (YjbR/CyaY superfamily)